MDFEITAPPARRTRGPTKSSKTGSATSSSLRQPTTSSTSSPRFSALAPRPDVSKKTSSDKLSGPKRNPPPRVKLRKTEMPLEQQLPLYRSAVDFGIVDLQQIDPRTWVAQVCNFPDVAPVTAGVDGWVIIKCEVNDKEDLSYDCAYCPEYAAHNTCVHVLLVSSDDPPSLRPITDEDSPSCVMFHHESEQLGQSLTMFIVDCAAKGQAVVSHYGATPDGGQWACRRCTSQPCVHVQRAQKHQAFFSLFDAQEDGQGEVQDDVDGETEVERVEGRSKASQYDHRSISYLPVGPPTWARLPSDTAPTYPALRTNPGHLSLGPDARCRCGRPADPARENKVIQCIVYGSLTAWRATIEVQRCTVCRLESRQYAGPDLRERGLFNYNNSRLFTHELLNGFTNSMTASETPFNSYRKFVSRTYLDSESPVPFVCNDVLRVAWFSFTRVQQLGDSFVCDVCGPDPDVVICDGISAGYRADRITETLRPPTVPDAASSHRLTVAAAPNSSLTFVANESLRRRAQLAVRWRKGINKDNASSIRAREGAGDSETDDSSSEVGIPGVERTDRVPDEDVDEAAPAKTAKSRKAKRDEGDARMRESLPKIAEDLSVVNESLAVFFGVHVESDYDEELEEITTLYLELLEQILAYESAVQFAPEASWPYILLLGQGDVESSETLLNMVPALARVARHELVEYDGAYTDELKTLATFVYQRALSVGATYSHHDPDDALLPQPVIEDWRETGTYYARPRIRSRPVYPHLKHDQKIERGTVSDSGGAIGCSKYYQEYGRKGLSGGLMVFWCTHSCCIGFHVIPKGEGRNDVFSALFCYWKTPPKTVIYDFACALAAYCFLREYRLFRNTQFLIDHFHAQGHTRCSKACFISAYRQYSARLRRTNSSAGESGNAGLHKIRKPLSYMTQRHAVIFSYVFLAIWNRERRRKLAGLS